MPLVDVIRAVTSTPAKAIGWGSRIGCLTPGKEADITVLKLKEGRFPMEDCQSQVFLYRLISLKLTNMYTSIWGMVYTSGNK